MSRVNTFYMYIFTPIFFKIKEICVISQILNLFFLFRVQVIIYGYVCMRMGMLVHNVEGMR